MMYDESFLYNEYHFPETISEYITEKLLGEALSVLFSGKEIIHNRKVKTLGFRPDYYIPSENIIVEFNGYSHYTNNKIVEMDYRKRKVAELKGIKTISIPYFVQLNSRMIYYYFSKLSNDFNDYPLGFVDNKVVLPGRFSSLGLNRFINEYKSFRDKEKGEKVVVPILVSLLKKYTQFNHTFFECFPFITDELIKNDMENGLYGFVDDEEIKYLKDSIKMNIKLINNKHFYYST